MYYRILFAKDLTRQLVRSNPDKVFLFGDNIADKASGYIPHMTQAVIRGMRNSIGIPTKHNRFTNDSSYFNDDQFDLFKVGVDLAITEALNRSTCIVIPQAGIGTGKAMLKQRAPKCYEYLQNKLRDLYENSLH